MSDKSQNLIFDNFPVIQLDGIVLRKISLEDDNENFFHYITKPQVTAYLSADDVPTDLDSSRLELGYWARLFEYRNSFYWTIAEEKSNKMIGTCGFNHWNKGQRRTEISYDLNYDYWGKGIMTQAIKAIVDFASNEMKVQRIQGTVELDNMPSIRVLEKAGFTRESILKQYGVLNGQVRDFYMYALCNG